MERAIRDLEPWQVPPDEAYWQALLQEGEYGEGSVLAPPGPAVPDLERSATITPTASVGPTASPALGEAPSRSPGAAQAPSSLPPASPPSLGTPDDEPVASFDVEPVHEPVRAPAGDPTADLDEAAADDPRTASQPLSGEPGCWDIFAQYQADGELVDLTVEGYNRGGLSGDAEG